jgi:hypothetical protein
MKNNITKRVLFFNMVFHPVKGWTRVGNAYSSKKAAVEWLPFVRGVWRGCRTKVSQCTIRFVDGVITEPSRLVLSEKFNLDS